MSSPLPLNCGRPGVDFLRRSVDEGAMHVHGEELNLRFLCRRQQRQPRLERVGTAPVANPQGLAVLEIAEDRNVLVLELVPSSEPLLIDANYPQGRCTPSQLPARLSVLLGASDGQPTQAVQRRDVHDGHRGCFDGQVLVEASRLALIGVSPREHLAGGATASRAFETTRLVLDLHGMSRPWQVSPSSLRQKLMSLAAWLGAMAASTHPSTGGHHRQLGLPQERIAADRLDAPTVSRLEERPNDLPPIESPDSCQHATSLSHRATCQVSNPTKRKPPQCCEVDRAAPLDVPARHDACGSISIATHLESTRRARLCAKVRARTCPASILLARLSRKSEQSRHRRRSVEQP